MLSESLPLKLKTPQKMCNPFNVAELVTFNAEILTVEESVLELANEYQKRS
jgi:hypothetical protein